MYFSTDIFISANLTPATSQYATLGMGGMNVLMTLISLVIIEKAGRKTLQLIGLGGMFVVTVLLTIFLALKVPTVERTRQVEMNHSYLHVVKLMNIQNCCDMIVDWFF